MTDLLIKQAFLAGFVNPVGFMPSFLEPVFVRTPNGNEYYLQECDDNHKIIRFVPGVEDDEEVQRIQPERRKRVGENAIYAFCSGPDASDVFADEQDKLAQRLTSDIAFYANYPGLLLEVLEFCRSREGISEARIRAYHKIGREIGYDAALAWRDTQIFLPLIQSSVRTVLATVVRDGALARAISTSFIRVQRTPSSILGVQVPRTIRKLLEVEKKGRYSIFGFLVREAMNDFSLKDIKVTSVEQFDNLIEALIAADTAEANIVPEVIDEGLAVKISEAGDEKFSLETSGTITGFGESLAKLQPSKSVLRPSVQVFVEKTLSIDLRAKVEARLHEWIRNDIETALGELCVLDRKLGSLSPQARRVVGALISGGGVVERKGVGTEVKKIDQEERSKLRALGVRFGTFHIYCPMLLKPGPRKLAGQLYATRIGTIDSSLFERLHNLVLSGRTSIPREEGIAPSLYRAIGYAPLGGYALRVDILERVADLIRSALSWRNEAGRPMPEGAVDGKYFTITFGMTSLTGVNAAGFEEVLLSLGYRKTGQIGRRGVERNTELHLEVDGDQDLWFPGQLEDYRALMETKSEKNSKFGPRSARPRGR